MLGANRKADPCRWLGRGEAFRLFATHTGGTQSARHIKPLHWYIACRLVLEGGFNPDDITPRVRGLIEQVERVTGAPVTLVDTGKYLDDFIALAYCPD